MIKKLSLFLCLPLLAAQKDDFPTAMVINPLHGLTVEQHAWAEPAQAAPILGVQELLSENDESIVQGKKLLEATKLVEAFPGRPSFSQILQPLASAINQFNTAAEFKTYSYSDRPLTWIQAAHTYLYRDYNWKGFQPAHSRSSRSGNSSGCDIVFLTAIARQLFLGNRDNATQLHYLFNGVRNGLGSVIYPQSEQKIEERDAALSRRSFASRYAPEQFPTCGLKLHVVEGLLQAVYGKDVKTICKVFPFETTPARSTFDANPVVTFFNTLKRSHVTQALIAIFAHTEKHYGEAKDTPVFEDYYGLVLAKAGGKESYTAALIAPASFQFSTRITEAQKIIEKVTGIKPE